MRFDFLVFSHQIGDVRAERVQPLSVLCRRWERFRARNAECSFGMIRVAQGSFAENVIALLSCAAFAESFKKPKDCAALITTNLNAALSKNRAMGQGRIMARRNPFG